MSGLHRTGHAQRQHATRDDHRRQQVQRQVGGPGGVFHKTHHIRAQEARHLAHGVDQGQAARGRASAEHGGRHRPEHRQAGEGAHGGDRQAEDRNGWGGGEVHRDDQAHSAHQHRHHQVPAALFAQVGGAAHHQHEHRRQQIGDCTQPADHQVIAEPHVLDDRRQPEVDGVHPTLDAEVDQAERPDRRVLEHFQQRISGGLGLVGQVGGLVGLEDCALMGGQPFGVGEAVAEQEVGEGAEDDRWNTLQQEHPLPAREATLARREVVEDPAGEWAAEQAGHRDCRHEQGHDPPTAEGREPLREVQHYAREKARFSGTGKQAQGVEVRRRGHKQQAGRCNKTPKTLVSAASNVKQALLVEPNTCHRP